jgi:hypothetical protein
MEWVFAHMADPDFEQPIVAPPAGAHHCSTQLSAAALRHFDGTVIGTAGSWQLGPQAGLGNKTVE